MDAAASMDALFMGDLDSVMDARASVAAIAEAQLEAASPVVDSTAEAKVSAVAAAASTAVAADMVVADIGKASILS
jgi:hypothetical protein